MGLLNRLAVLPVFQNRQAASKNDTIPHPHFLLWGHSLFSNWAAALQKRQPIKGISSLYKGERIRVRACFTVIFYAERPLDGRLIYQYHEWFLSAPHKVKTHVAVIQGRVIAFDPGVRTFQSFYCWKPSRANWFIMILGPLQFLRDDFIAPLKRPVKLNYRWKVPKLE